MIILKMKRKGFFVKAVIPLALIFTLLMSLTTLGAAADGGAVSEPFAVTYLTASDSPDGVAKLSVMLDASVLEGEGLSSDLPEKLLNEITEALYEIAYDSVFVVSTAQPSPTPINASAGGNVLPDIDLSGIDIENLESFLRDQLDLMTPDVAKEKLDRLMAGDFDHVIEIAVDKYLDNTGYTAEQIEAKTSSVMDSIIDALYQDEPLVAEEKKQQSEVKIGEIVTVVTESRENGESITFTLEDLSTVSSIRVDNITVFDNGSFSLNKVRELIDTLPLPSEIRGFDDGEMQRELSVVAEFVFGEIAFDLTVGLTGDCDTVRKCAGILDDYFEITYGDGALSVTVTVPESLSDALAKALNEGDIPDSLKDKLFSLGMKTGEDIDLYLKDFSFADMKDMLAELDLTDILSTGPLSDFIDVEGKTNDEILLEIDKLERAYNLALDITAAFMDKLPEDKLSMTLLEVYDGDGVMRARDSVDFTLEGLFNTVSEKYGALLASFFDEGEIELDIDLTLTLESVRRVTFKDAGGEIFADGFLPKGASTAYFAGIDEYQGKRITGWYSGSEFFTVMPGRDIELFAYYGGHLEASVVSGVLATYAPGVTHTLSLNTTYLPISGEFSLSYQWLLDGEEIDGATDSTYTVSDVADSGFYSCIVSVSEGSYFKSVYSDAGEVKIDPAGLDVSGVRWNYSTPFVYNGQGQSVSLVGLPAGVTASYTNYNGSFEPIDYTPTDSGTYITSVRLAYDRENYVLSGNAFSFTLEWRIVKATVDMSGVSLQPKTVYYDGNPHSIEITGTLPSGVTVTYTGGGTDVGEYLVTAHFSVNTKNYNTVRPLEARLTILPASADIPLGPGEREVFKIYNSSGELLVELTASEPIADGIDFKAYPRELSTLDDVDFKALFGGGKEIFFSEVYDLHFEDSVGETDIENNSFTVKLLIPKALRERERLSVLHLSSGVATVLSGVTREGDYMSFETDGFSLFAIVADEDADELLWLWIILLIIIIIVVILIVFRRPEDGEDESSEPDTDGEPNYDASSEDTPTAEAPTDEAPTDEAPTDEAPAEEEPTEEEPTEEEPTEEAPEAVSAPIDTVAVRYRSSFTSRLIQSEAPIQDYYTTLKNYILSFEGIKARTSFGYEAYSLRRTQCVRLNVKGKAILVNLALDPTQYSESKYHFTVDTKLSDVPMLIKVKSDRALKYAIELIDEVMSTLGVDQGDIPTVDYHMPYETNSALAARGLVKVILPKGVSLTDSSEVVETDIGALLGGSREASSALGEAERIIDGTDNTARAVTARYRGSFTSRLIQSGDRAQDFYTDIRNYLLSFAGVKCRTSWNFESYNKGRVKLARINIKGKTLTVNLALAPGEFSQSKYHFTDVSADPKLEKLPMQMKVRSERAKKYVIALIDELMKSLGIKQGEIPTESYRMPYETNDELVARGLMKLVLAKGASLEEGDVQMQNIGELIRGELADNAAAPTGEEVFVPTEPVFADKVLADALLDDKSAEASLEHIHVPHGMGKLCGINLGELCMHFEAGEVVTLAALREKGLIGKAYGRVKILAGGVMTKPLTVVADKFSVQAIKMITLAGGTARQIDID